MDLAQKPSYPTQPTVRVERGRWVRPSTRRSASRGASADAENPTCPAQQSGALLHAKSLWGVRPPCAVRSGTVTFAQVSESYWRSQSFTTTSDPRCQMQFDSSIRQV